jgi:hypothetical protein
MLDDDDANGRRDRDDRCRRASRIAVSAIILAGAIVVIILAIHALFWCLPNFDGTVVCNHDPVDIVVLVVTMCGVVALMSNHLLQTE